MENVVWFQVLRWTVDKIQKGNLKSPLLEIGKTKQQDTRKTSCRWISRFLFPYYSLTPEQICEINPSLHETVDLSWVWIAQMNK